MKNLIHISDLKLIIELIGFENQKIKIIDPFNQIQMNSGEFLADYNTPNSLFFFNISEKITSYDFSIYDMIIDFSGQTNKNNSNNYFFQLFFNEDESIKCLTTKKSSDLKSLFKDEVKIPFYKKLFQRERKLNFSVISNKQLFFEKQIQHLPHDNFVVDFGKSKANRRILLALTNNKIPVSFVKIARNQDEIKSFSHEKYMLSKLSFTRFNFFECPSEYFMKNPKVMVKSSVYRGKNSSTNYNQILENCLVEIFNKTHIKSAIDNSQFWENTLNQIYEIKDFSKKQFISKLFHSISIHNHIYFSLSLGDLSTKKCYYDENKLYYFDMKSASFELPAFYDIFLNYIHSLDDLENFNVLDCKKYIEFLFKNDEIDDKIDVDYLNVNLYIQLHLLHFYLTSSLVLSGENLMKTENILSELIQSKVQGKINLAS